MRLIPSTAALFLLAACGTTPTPVATVAPPAPVVPREQGGLIGLDANALASRFGAPRLQVREGVGLKLQYARGTCVLDAYLYPGIGGGAARVTHVDTRNREGRPFDQPSCIAMIGAR